MTKSTNGFTKTEQRMLDLLGDGERHSRDELHGCMQDKESSRSSLRQHICNIRKKLSDTGQYLATEQYRGGIYYRWLGKRSAPSLP